MREIMEIKKTRHTEVAKMLEVTRGHWANILAGRRKVNMKGLKKLIDFFGAELMSRAIDWEGVNASVFVG